MFTNIRTYESHEQMPAQIIFPELSYQVMGVVFDLAKKLPIGLPEKDYQRGLALLLDEHKIKFRREVYIPISLAGKVISRYFADFVIDEKIFLN